MHIPTTNRVLLALALLASEATNADSLNVEVSVPVDRQGTVMGAVFDKADGFPRGKPLLTATAQPSQGKAILQFTDLPKGDYAVTAFLDENSNTKLDTNLFGLPIELYGFSRNARNLTGPPAFAEASFHLDNGTRQQAFELK